jgi:glycosyltransferase involved in cell wall biosynthesis
MKRYLLVTSLDVKRQPNNREHHLINHIAPRFSEAWVAYRKRNDQGDHSRRISQLLFASSKVDRQRDGLTFLEVDPMFNSPPNMAMDVTQSYQIDGESGTNRSQSRLYYLLNGLGILKDLSYIFFMSVFILVRIPGRFDVGVAMGPLGSAVVYLLKKNGKIRCHVYEDRDYEEGFFHNPLRRAFVGWLERAGIRSADQVISIGERLAALRKEQTGRVVPVVTTGVDVSRYHCNRKPVTDSPQLVYVGNVTHWSGLEVIIEGFALFRRHFPDATLKIVGEGLPGYQKTLIEVAQQHSITEFVTFTGRVENSEIPGYLAQAHLGIAVFRPIQLRAYAFPLKLLEYMAAGLPVLGNHDTETGDVILKHDVGACVDFDAEEFAKACVEILSDADRYQKLSSNALEAVKEYNWPTLMDQDYQLIKEACVNLEP